MYFCINIKSVFIFQNVCVCVCIKKVYIFSITLIRPSLIPNGFGFAGIAVNT